MVVDDDCELLVSIRWLRELNIEATALLAQTASDWKDSSKNLIFIGVFLLVMIAVIIWWLRRG